MSSARLGLALVFFVFFSTVSPLPLLKPRSPFLFYVADSGNNTNKHLISERRSFLICSGDSLVLVATAVGSLPGALGVQCSGAAMTSVTTTHEQIGPHGTSAENG
jgi:hypothetical protein